jgi:hypothetical protein
MRHVLRTGEDRWRSGLDKFYCVDIDVDVDVYNKIEFFRICLSFETLFMNMPPFANQSFKTQHNMGTNNFSTVLWFSVPEDNSLLIFDVSFLGRESVKTEATNLPTYTSIRAESRYWEGKTVWYFLKSALGSEFKTSFSGHLYPG